MIFAELYHNQIRLQAQMLNREIETRVQYKFYTLQPWFILK